MRVVRELDSGGYDLFHYSGHVAVPFDTSYVGLRLHEDKLLDERVLRSLSNTGVPPIVFVNGCASADRLGNLCVSFMATGAKVVIGTRYEVAEDSARRFAERFYAALIGGAPAGAAVRLARQDLRRHADIDWASFVLYGDPSVLITAGQEPADEPAGKAAARLPDGRVGPDLQATALVDRLLRRAPDMYRAVVTRLVLPARWSSTARAGTPAPCTVSVGSGIRRAEPCGGRHGPRLTRWSAENGWTVRRPRGKLAQAVASTEEVRPMNAVSRWVLPSSSRSGG